MSSALRISALILANTLKLIIIIILLLFLLIKSMNTNMEFDEATVIVKSSVCVRVCEV